MDFTMRGTRVSVKETSTRCFVPSNPKAKLMYYLSCVSSVLDIRSELPGRFLNYETGYNLLTSREVGQLLELCQLVSPEKLTGKCIFEKNDLDSNNEFYELSSVESSMRISSSLMIAGRNVRVAKIMLYKRTWRRNMYDEPMAELMLSRVFSVGSGEDCILL